MEKENMVENVVIIGGGPAGLSCALYTARAGLTPLVLAGSPPGGQLTLTTEVENYPGIESILGPELIEKMRAHAKKFGTRVIDQNVVKVDFSEKPYKTYTTNMTYRSNAVVIATGAKALWLGLDSETRLRGRGVSACATCDGFFFKNKVVAVVGGGDTALEEASTLTKFASKVYLIHRRDSFRASKIMQDRVMNNPKVEIITNAQVVEVLGDGVVTGVKLKMQESTKELKLDGLFIAIGHKPDTDLFKGQIDLDEKGYVVTSATHALESHKSQVISQKSVFNYDFQTMTSVDGVFAAGDNVDHVYRQAITAAGMGVAAALEVEKWLEISNKK